MASVKHHVIIGNGVAGNRAAAVLRERRPKDRITILSLGAFLLYDRYELPDVLKGRHDWRDYLVNPPAYYEDNAIAVRRRCLVTQVDTNRRVLSLGHREEVPYDTLLVASGGRSYLPVGLRGSEKLFNYFNAYRAAMATSRSLTKGGTAILLGGDILGLDMARTLISSGRRVVLVPSVHTFSPHKVDADKRAGFFDALERIGIEVTEEEGVERVEEGKKGKPPRRVTLTNGRKIDGDVVMPFYGLVPAVEFMVGSGVDIERGLLVSPELNTTDNRVWAAGDVCQIWSEEDKAYRFYYGRRNVDAMGEVAARNMSGEHMAFKSTVDETLSLDKKGQIQTEFWERN
jgi:NAD(P)H-nitrite reductase large subunit